MGEPIGSYGAGCEDGDYSGQMADQMITVSPIRSFSVSRPGLWQGKTRRISKKSANESRGD